MSAPIVGPDGSVTLTATVDGTPHVVVLDGLASLLGGGGGGEPQTEPGGGALPPDPGETAIDYRERGGLTTAPDVCRFDPWALAAIGGGPAEFGAWIPAGAPWTMPPGLTA